MRSFNLDIAAVCQALKEDGELNRPVGWARDEHGVYLAIFIGTDRETGTPTWTPDGKRLRFNVRMSNRQESKPQSAGQISLDFDPELVPSAGSNEDLPF